MKYPIREDELTGAYDGSLPVLTEGQKRTRNGKLRYARERDKLITELGGRCAIENCSTPDDRLHIDHVGGTRTWSMEKCNRWTRITRIRKEMQQGIRFRVLCCHCSARDAAIRRNTRRRDPNWRTLQVDRGYLGL